MRRFACRQLHAASPVVDSSSGKHHQVRASMLDRNAISGVRRPSAISCGNTHRRRLESRRLVQKIDVIIRRWRVYRPASRLVHDMCTPCVCFVPHAHARHLTCYCLPQLNLRRQLTDDGRHEDGQQRPGLHGDACRNRHRKPQHQAQAHCCCERDWLGALPAALTT